MRIGAQYLGENTCEFTVWAPREQRMELRLLEPHPGVMPMEPLERGYWRVVAEGIAPGARYVYRLEGHGHERPDPASHFQPEGVHRPSAVVDHGSFPWQDAGWQGRPLAEYVLYELHVGTFTPEGTFEAIIPRLATLRELGVTALELMPVSQFPGTRGWGYDGVHHFAPQNSYGGPEGLKRLVDACHREGLAVVLDVVYNHLGPEGNYLREFGPYFTPKYRTPWGDAINMDDGGSDEVRHFFIENALFWFREYHVDSLRLDATDRIYDFSAKVFLEELTERVRELERQAGRPCLLVAETDLNDPRLLRSPEVGGFGLDGQWVDDFHHSLHTLLTGEDLGYYVDFGLLGDLAKSYRDGYVFDGRFSPYRWRRRGAPAPDRPARQFVVFAQNHDQIGNRMFGHRLLSLTSFEAAKVAAAAVLLSPFIPLIFMGEEFAEDAPFLFFADFQDLALREAVHKGRIEEFAAFKWRGEPPDPHDPATFERSRIDWEKRQAEGHGTMLVWYERLLRLRREMPALAAGETGDRETGTLDEQKVVWIHRWRNSAEVLLLLNFNAESVTFLCPTGKRRWRKLLDSAEPAWRGTGATLAETAAAGDELTMPPVSCALYENF